SRGTEDVDASDREAPDGAAGTPGRPGTGWLGAALRHRQRLLDAADRRADSRAGFRQSLGTSTSSATARTRRRCVALRMFPIIVCPIVEWWGPNLGPPLVGSSAIGDHVIG